MPEKEHILVVDDDIDFLSIITRILKSKGYDVQEAGTAGEAMTHATHRFFNAAILDISLPDADGTELLSRLLEIQPDIIAIILTGYSSVQNAVKSLNQGAFSYLEKPVSPDSLLSVISRGLEKQRLVLENRQLLEELEQRNHITNTLLNVSQAVSQSLDLEKIIYSALDRITKSTNIEAGFVYLLKDNKLVLTGSQGFPESLTPEIPREIWRNDGIPGTILANSENTIIDKTRINNDPELNYLKNGGYQAFAGIPLTILGDSIGILGVATSYELFFSPINIELINGIAREIAIAVHNARLYEEASSAKALRELDMMRTEFLANVSHELRTPLAIIKGSANSLLQPDVIFDEQTRREFLQSIDKDADTLSRLVDDLLIMSRLEANAFEVSRKTQPLANVLDIIRDRLENLTVEHHLIINMSENLPLVNIDEVRIGAVLTNLVENAIKFSEKNTKLTIEASSNGEQVIISVTDEGIGIPAEVQGKIFERFFQGNGHKAGRRKGTGLGLSICRGIVEAHNGRIWVESKPSKGTTFKFCLPASQGSTENE
jgi:K+-sensing histidine kinase KdpD